MTWTVFFTVCFHHTSSPPLEGFKNRFFKGGKRSRSTLVISTVVSLARNVVGSSAVLKPQPFTGTNAMHKFANSQHNELSSKFE